MNRTFEERVNDLREDAKRARRRGVPVECGADLIIELIERATRRPESP